jgi:hypothetical protein
MLASSTKHKTGDDQRSQPERGAQKKKNPKGTTHRRKRRETVQNSKSMIFKISWVLESSPTRIEKPWKAF